MAHAGNPKPCVRFRDECGLDADDERLHHLFRALPELEAFAPSKLERVERRFSRSSATGSAAMRFPRPLLILAAALAGAGVATAGFGVMSVFTSPAATHETSEALAPASQRADRAPVGARAPAPEPAREAAREPLPASRTNGPTFAFQADPPTRAEPPPSSPSAADATLARESEMLQQALVKLRQQGDARGALSVLDRYELEFPRGKLLREAQVTRIDALLRASERARALALLERLPLAGLGRGDELRVLRAELRAERECGQALPEFDALVGLPLAAALAERSLYGRAACRLQLGDEAGGRADLLLYQERYPLGRFAERARARLESR